MSNRGPVGFRRAPDGELTTVRGAGGLVTALRPIVDRGDVTGPRARWATPSASWPPPAPEERSTAGTPFRLRLVAHDPEAYRLFYGVVANPVLWFVQHGCGT